MRLPLILALLLAASPPATALQAPGADTGVLGIRSGQLHPDYWIARQAQPDRVILDRAAIDAQNAGLRRDDPSMHDLSRLPATLPGEQVRGWISKLSAPPTRTLYDEQGTALDAAALDALQQSLRLDAIAAAVTPRFGLVVQRADLRGFPTRTRVFRDTKDHDIDRFQESAAFPGTPVAIVHESADGRWWFVLSPTYAAWIEKQYVAEGSRDEALGYGHDGPYVVVTGADVRSTFTPDEPRVSSLQLDMGLKLPLLADWPARQAVNGQDPYASYVVRLPVRDGDGRLRFAPALLPRSADVSADYLPLTAANLVRQGFKFLGERYGWGHSYGTRDCSGFVSEIYRSMGVELPRNTGDQAVSPALNRIALGDKDDHARRMKLIAETRTGDLIYIPGHVMMVIGHDNGRTWVIHDTSGVSWLDAGGQRLRAHLNGVSVTPFEPLLYGDDGVFADHVTNIQRIRP